MLGSKCWKSDLKVHEEAVQHFTEGDEIKQHVLNGHRSFILRIELMRS